MRKLLHAKANALQNICDLTEELCEKLQQVRDVEAAPMLQALLDARSARMAEVDQLDKRIRFLEDSGYTPPRADDRAFIEMELTTIRTLLEKIQAFDQGNMPIVETFRDELSASLKDLQDGRKSIVAYNPPPEDAEGITLDTLR